MPDEPSHVEILADDQEPERPPVTDVDRAPEPPEHIEGAQWDEVHRRWERWDETTGQWVVVGDPGDGVDPNEETKYDPLLARELLRAEELEAAHVHVEDVDRQPEPPQHVTGAQWNEVAARWEHWDEATGTWAEVPPAP